MTNIVYLENELKVVFLSPCIWFIEKYTVTLEWKKKSNQLPMITKQVKNIHRDNKIKHRVSTISNFLIKIDICTIWNPCS